MIGTFSGIIITIIAFALGNTLPRFARKAFRLAMLARLSISVLNVMMAGGMIGAGQDANYLYSLAIEGSSNIENLEWGLGALFGGLNGLRNIHALIQWALGGESFFLAHAFSLLGAALCLIIISKIWLLLVPTEYKKLPYVLLIYSLLPSVITNQSYILREVWQSLCVLGIAWLSLHIQRYGYNVTRIIGILIFTVVGCFLHAYMVIMMILMLLVGLMIQSKISVTRLFMRPARLFKFGFILVLFLLIVSPLIIESAHFQLLLDGQLMQHADSFSEGAMADAQGARAEYGRQFYSERPWTLLSAFAAYQMMPLPWRFGGIADLVLFVENMFRVLLLLSYLCYRKKLTQFHKDNMDALILMWFLMELVWSVGTINWGTAARHHVPAVGLLLIVGLASRYLVKTERLYIRRRQPTKQLGG
ncbi:MAG: hypothetical protein NTX75_03515 [Proteobacteria bacterium]|nr:hypothetical protein [Pseudomonadota bacterium]